MCTHQGMFRAAWHHELRAFDASSLAIGALRFLRIHMITSDLELYTLHSPQRLAVDI